MQTQTFLPPADLIALTGSRTPEEYYRTSEEFMGYFTDLGKLLPHDRVLDLGCGCGRMALALCEYLDSRGSYEGIDVLQESVNWCREHITPCFPNFRFQVADVVNTTYNPAGNALPHRYRLPFASATFDFVFLTSVFTHMLPRGMTNYLEEIARVLKIGGHCLITFFLLNQESVRLIHAGRSVFQFPYRLGPCCVRDASRPEDVVAYEEKGVLALFRDCGLQARTPVYYGSWCGRDTFISFQDMVVASKVRDAGFGSHIKRAVRRLIPVAEPGFAANGPVACCPANNP